MAPTATSQLRTTLVSKYKEHLYIHTSKYSTRTVLIFRDTVIANKIANNRACSKAGVSGRAGGRGEGTQQQHTAAQVEETHLWTRPHLVLLRRDEEDDGVPIPGTLGAVRVAARRRKRERDRRGEGNKKTDTMNLSGRKHTKTNINMNTAKNHQNQNHDSHIRPSIKAMADAPTHTLMSSVTKIHSVRPTAAAQ